MSYFWNRFLILTPLGKAVTVIAVLGGTGWLAGTLGWHTLARQLWSAALLVVGLLLTVLVIRWVWSYFTGKPGQ